MVRAIKGDMWLIILWYGRFHLLNFLLGLI
jgi:hypothetical protein